MRVIEKSCIMAAQRGYIPKIFRAVDFSLALLIFFFRFRAYALFCPKCVVPPPRRKTKNCHTNRALSLSLVSVDTEGDGEKMETV